MIQLHKALLREIPEHLEDGMSPELMLLRRKLATWAHDLTELPRPQLPDILMRQAGRTGDNWRVLFAIAQLAGGCWPALVERAALNAVMSESKQTMVQRLLVSIRRIFDARGSNTALPCDDRGRIPTKDLIAALLSDEREEWGTANRGRAITEYWLRDNLRHLLDPPATQQWEGPTRGSKRGERFRGYLWTQFTNAWERHLPADSISAYPFAASGGSVVSAESEQNHGDSENLASGGEELIQGINPEHTPDGPSYPRSQNARNSSDPAISADTPDPPDASGGDRENKIRAAPIRRPSAPAKPNGHAVPNGHDGPNGHYVPAEPETMHTAIVAYAKLNPTKLAATIAKEFGQPENVVTALLEGITR